MKNIQELNNYLPQKNLLKDKFIVVTGATDGIGNALAIACVEHGARLLLLGKNEDKLEALLQKLSELSDNSHQSYLLDLEFAAESDYISFAEYIATLDSPIDSLIQNAGYIEALQGIRNYPLDTWLKTITINQHAPFMLARCCIPSLECSADPSIVFSTHACTKAYWGAYGVAKSAQLGLMKILADELDGDKPIRVNGVDPSPVNTKLRTANFPGVNPQSYATPEDIVAPYLFFIGPDSQGVTGSNYKINSEFSG